MKPFGPLALLLFLALAPAAPRADAVPSPPAAVVAYTVTDGRRIEASLTGAPGDPAAGRALYAGEAGRGCVVCHGLPEAAAPAAPPFARAPRRSVPALEGVGARLDPAEIRLRLIAPEFLDPEARCSVYAAGQREDPTDPLWGGPRLPAAAVEDLVAFLAGLG
jgi:sulfur-oxidizing protein SoxX